MIKRLFFTGEIGCGKSTLIQTALGDHLQTCGGFLTKRYRSPHLHFTLEDPAGRIKTTFLDFRTGKPQLNLDAFIDPGRSLLEGKVLVMDEIGGIELLCPELSAALEAVLKTDTPIVGVIKGVGPAGALIEALGLTQSYSQAAEKLWNMLRNDPNTLIFKCGKYDQQALCLAKQWTEEYLHGKLF